MKQQIWIFKVSSFKPSGLRCLLNGFMYLIKILYFEEGKWTGDKVDFRTLETSITLLS